MRAAYLLTVHTGEYMRSKYLRICALLLLLCISAASHADLHKWVDANGVTHYSENVPSGQESTTVKTPVAPPPDSANSSALKDEVEKANAMVEAHKRKVAAEEQQEAANRKAAADKNARCGYEKNRLQGLQQANRVATFGPDGQKVYVSDAERQHMIDQAQNAVSNYCN